MMQFLMFFYNFCRWFQRNFSKIKVQESIQESMQESMYGSATEPDLDEVPEEETSDPSMKSVLVSISVLFFWV